MSVSYPESTMEIADMLHDDIPFCKEWGKAAVLPWVQWFIDNGRYYAVSSKGKLCGVTLLRFVDSEEDCHEHYKDTGGQICYVEVSVSKHVDALKSMYELMWNEIGKDTKYMAWMRHKYNNRVTMVDMGRAKRRLMR